MNPETTRMQCSGKRATDRWWSQATETGIRSAGSLTTRVSNGTEFVSDDSKRSGGLEGRRVASVNPGANVKDKELTVLTKNVVPATAMVNADTSSRAETKGRSRN